MTKHIAVIDPAVKTAETDCFNRMALEAPLKLTYHLPKLAGMESLPIASADLEGIIILGSASSVNDNEPWQKALNNWLMPQLQRGIPTLGLCYGHQLLAHLFGGKVGFLFPDKHKLQGFRKVSLASNDLWDGHSMDGELAVTHREAVLSCPKDFSVTGRSTDVAIDAIAHQSLPIWGFQSHPEATLSFCTQYGISAENLDAKLRFGHRLLSYFFSYVEQRA